MVRAAMGRLRHHNAFRHCFKAIAAEVEHHSDEDRENHDCGAQLVNLNMHCGDLSEAEWNVD